MFTRTVITSSFVLLLSGVQVTYADANANFGIASNYVWRGKTMTADRPAISGGIDYTHPNHHYMGLWTTNVEDAEDNNNEGSRIDLYAGTYQDAGPIELELGLIHYYFNRGNRYISGVDNEPDSANKNSFSELLIGISYDIYTARLYTSNDYLGSGFSSTYWQAGIDYPIRDDISLAAYYGILKSKAIDNSNHDLSDFLVSLTKGEYSITWTNLDDHADAYQSENFRLTLNWRHPIKL